MSRYLVIESRNGWESGDVAYAFGLAKDLAAAGHDVTLYLVQNGVMPARKDAKDPALADLMKAGKVKVLADDFSLRERGIEQGELLRGIAASKIDVVIDLMAAGAKSIWH
jgi:predicted peroxiredoxin